MARPLDEIADWQDIHGITPHLVDMYGQLIIETRVFSYGVPNIFFTERHFIDVMKLRETYIKRLHSLLTERLPPGSNIKIHLTPSSSNHITASTYAEGMQTLNDRVIARQAGGPNAIRKAEIDSINASIISILVTYIGEDEGRPDPIPYAFRFNIANPVKPHYSVGWGFMNPRVGADVPDIVYNTVKDLKDDASSKVINLSKALIYRPPGLLTPNNTGGPGYIRSLTEFTRHRGGKRSRTMRRKTNRKKRHSKR